MNSPPSDDRPAELPPTVHFNTRGEFQAAWRSALAQIAQQGCRELWFSNSDYADWPLGEAASVELLTTWAMSHRRLVVLAAQFDTLQRQHPRWVRWRRQWSHVVHCRQVEESDVSSIPTMVLAPGLLTLRVLDPLNLRGRLSYERADAVRDQDDLDAYLQRSEEAFPATSLGL